MYDSMRDGVNVIMVEPYDAMREEVNVIMGDECEKF
jgi:hypothetical protein